MKIKTIDSKFYSILGDKLRDIRKQRGFSINYMAKQIGISRQCYDMYELGILKIKPKVWDKICDVLQIYPDIDISLKVGL